MFSPQECDGGAAAVSATLGTDMADAVASASPLKLPAAAPLRLCSERGTDSARARPAGGGGGHWARAVHDNVNKQSADVEICFYDVRPT